MIDELTTPIERGRRVRSARVFAGLTRRQLAGKYEIYPTTLQQWEVPYDDTGLTKKGAERLVSVLKEENVVCSVDWLLEGIGSGPRLTSDLTGTIKSPEQKGRRVRAARAFAGLSRQQLVDKYKIPLNTLRQWETPGKGEFGLTQKGAERLLLALKGEKVACNVEWLLEGTGGGPYLVLDWVKITKKVCDSEARHPDQIIRKEIEFFRELNPDPIIILIIDNGMEPQFDAGSYVAGNRRYKKDIQALLGYFCIVELEDGSTLVRKLTVGNQENTYTLSCINHSIAIEPVLYNVPIKSAAEVVWYRRKTHLSL